LKTYAEKRDFQKTAEPKPAAARSSRQGSRRRFVIQKHAASHLHYDFRLEMHDVLKSWSIPKGPPFKEDERRLAMPTEDHPIDYLDFEGIIPKGQYGGGTVMVWDLGTYELIEGNYYKGFLRFYLNGAKLKGEWTMTRFAVANDETDKRDKWHLIKTGGNTRVVSKARDDQSVLTKRTMAQIASAADAVWQSNR
jgi:bifunctional non-homologous end joining protein LigD